MATELMGYVFAFAATLLIEAAVAVVFGYRKRYEIGVVLLINLFSHPLLIFLLWTIDRFRLSPVAGWEIVLFEAVVVAVEWLLLCFALRGPRFRLFVLSLTMNCASYLTGFMLSI